MPWVEAEDLIHWDTLTCRWVCICKRFRRRGKCSHVLFFRKTADVPVLEEYL